MGALYHRFRNVTYWAALKVLGDPDEAEDVVHDVFLRLLENDSRGRELRPSFFRMAGRNGAMHLLRGRKGTVSTETVSLVSGRMDPDMRVIWLGEAKRIRRMLDDLPERCREVARLKLYKEATSRAIAEELGISEKAVEKQLARARSLLTNRVGSRPR